MFIQTFGFSTSSNVCFGKISCILIIKHMNTIHISPDNTKMLVFRIKYLSRQNRFGSNCRLSPNYTFFSFGTCVRIQTYWFTYHVLFTFILFLVKVHIRHKNHFWLWSVVLPILIHICLQVQRYEIVKSTQRRKLYEKQKIIENTDFVYGYG